MKRKLFFVSLTLALLSCKKEKEWKCTTVIKLENPEVSIGNPDGIELFSREYFTFVGTEEEKIYKESTFSSYLLTPTLDGAWDTVNTIHTTTCY